jgi:ornithine cyclodeaminase/alanine dehydrogenase-like protein (mu-crystallin family)
MLVLNEQEVRGLLDFEGCIEAMTAALAGLARGEFHLPLRPVVRPPDVGHLLGLMPTYRGGERPLYALKTVAIFPDNPSRGLDPHQGAVTLFDGGTGRVLAVLNASPITAIRTAACSAVATRALAREDSRELAIVGAGHQAHAHLEALTGIFDFERIRIAARTPEHARELADLHALAEPATAEAAVRACFPTTRELDAATVAASTLFVDRRESAENEAGDYLLALAEGAIGPAHIEAELGEVLIGAHPGRTSPEELTVFESLGLAIEDLAAAEYVVERARAAGRGTELDF